MTLDIRSLEMILTEFRISTYTDSTSVVMQLTCYSAGNSHSLLYARFTVLHVAQGKPEVFEACTKPSSSEPNSKKHLLNSNHNSQTPGRGYHSRSAPSTRFSAIMEYFFTVWCGSHKQHVSEMWTEMSLKCEG